MPTTSNFGWTTPADTDLVKDGAAAIRTLGNGIDTSLVDLKGGTTNQVLAKNSNTDLDFKWVADATGIPATIFDAKGDIIAATAADTADRLAVGTNGQVLTADSSTATGLKWATPATGGMTLLSTTSLSGATTTVNSISQDYKDILIVLRDLVAGTDGEGFCFRLNGDSNTRYFTTQTSTGGSAFNDTKFNMTGPVDNSVGNGLGWFRLTDYTNSTTWKLMDYVFTTPLASDTAQVIVNRGAGTYNQIDAITSITFLMTAGNITSGTALIYGVK